MSGAVDDQNERERRNECYTLIFFIIIIFFLNYICIIFLLLLELFILGYTYIYLHVSLYIVCVVYALNVRSTMEIRRSHLCDFFLVFPFL